MMRSTKHFIFKAKGKFRMSIWDWKEMRPMIGVVPIFIQIPQ